jgi:uncharacterized membrane protein YhaH (DUF805 family)
MLIASDYPFAELMWTMFIFFAWVIWLVCLFSILADNFRRQDHSGWSKAGWTAFLIFLPVIGAFVYVLKRPEFIPPRVA